MIQTSLTVTMQGSLSTITCIPSSPMNMNMSNCLKCSLTLSSCSVGNVMFPKINVSKFRDMGDLK